MQKIERRDRGVSMTIMAFLFLFFSTLLFADTGEEALLKQAKSIFGPLPQVMSSEKNPITPEKVKLGKILFYETRISVDGTVSCARCHPIGLYAADGLRKAVGNNCKINPRNAPTILNAANEVAVEAFLLRKISFEKIPIFIDRALSRAAIRPSPELGDIIESDLETRRFVGTLS